MRIVAAPIVPHVERISITQSLEAHHPQPSQGESPKPASLADVRGLVAKHIKSENSVIVIDDSDSSRDGDASDDDDAVERRPVVLSVTIPASLAPNVCTELMNFYACYICTISLSYCSGRATLTLLPSIAHIPTRSFSGLC